jgi:hypothetical protein
MRKNQRNAWHKMRAAKKRVQMSRSQCLAAAASEGSDARLKKTASPLSHFVARALL